MTRFVIKDVSGLSGHPNVVQWVILASLSANARIPFGPGRKTLRLFL